MRFIAAALVLFVAVPVQAAQSSSGGKTYFHFFAGAKTSNKESKTGVIGGLDVFHAVQSRLSLGAGFAYSKYDNKVKTMSLGDVKMAAIMGKARIHSDLDRPGNVYLEGGVGIAIMDHTLDPMVDSLCAILLLRCEEDLGNTVTYSVGGGANYSISENFSVGTWFGYQILKPELTVTVTNLVNGAFATAKTKVPLNSFNAGGGATLRF